MKSKLRALIWKIFWKLFPPKTVIDQLRMKNDSELLEVLRRIYMGEELWSGFANQFCGKCPVTDTAIINGQYTEFHPCDDLDGGCPHGDVFGWWLQSEVDDEEL